MSRYDHLKPKETSKLGAIGNAISNTGARFQQQLGGFALGIGNSAEQYDSAMEGIEQQLSQATDPAERRALEKSRNDQAGEAGALSRLAAMAGIGDELQGIGQSMTGSAATKLEQNGPGIMSPGAQLAHDATGAVIDMAPVVGTALATRGKSMIPAMAVSGGQVYGQTYATLVGKHGHQTANDVAATSAILEGITEKLPLDAILSPGGPLLKRLAKAGVTEGAQEALVGYLQEANRSGLLDNKSPAEALGDAANATRLYDALLGGTVGVTMAGAAAPFQGGIGGQVKADQDPDGENANSDIGLDQPEQTGEPLKPAPGTVLSTTEAGLGIQSELVVPDQKIQPAQPEPVIEPEPVQPDYPDSPEPEPIVDQIIDPDAERSVSIPESIPETENIGQESAGDLAIPDAIPDATSAEGVPATEPQSIESRPKGKSVKVHTPDGEPLDHHYRVVDLDDLITSHDADGSENPAFPQDLQPRDRSKASSRMQVRKIGNNLNFDLLADSPTTDNGAPIVGADGITESGNGRTIGMQIAYKEGKADEYVKRLTERAGEFGIDPSELSGIEKPVLVRVRDTNVDRKAFAEVSNKPAIAAQSPAELAKQDSGNIDLSQMQDTDIQSADNREFVKAFINKLPSTEAAGLIDSNGRPTRQAYDRLNSALFQSAYESDALIKMQSEEADSDIRNLLSALSISAKSFAKARQAEPKQAGDIIADVVRAADLVKAAKDKNQPVEEYLKTDDMFDAEPDLAKQLAVTISQNKRSPKRLGIMLQKMGELLESNVSRSDDMFGDGSISNEDLVNATNRETEKELGEGSPRIGEAKTAEPSDTRSEQGGDGRTAAEVNEEQLSLFTGKKSKGKAKKTVKPAPTVQRSLFPIESKAEIKKDPVAAANRVVDTMRKPPYKILANKMVKEWDDKSSMSIVGAKADSPKSIALAAQVYRNPSFETFRVFFVKDGVVVGQTGLSNREPGSVSFPSNYTETVREQMKSTGADGYYMLHNHPSGNPDPSRADLRFTSILASEVPGLKSHIVIDTTSYATINKDGGTFTHKLPDAKPDYDPDVVTQWSMVNDAVTKPEKRTMQDLAQRAKWVAENPESSFHIIGTGRNIRAIAEVSYDALKKLSKGRLAANLQKFKKETGSISVHVVADPKYYDQGLLRDLVSDANELGGNVVDYEGNPLIQNMPGPSGKYTHKEAAPARTKNDAADQYNPKTGKYDSDTNADNNSADQSSVQEGADGDSVSDKETQIITSQRYRSESIVSDKIKNKDFTVSVSPEFEIDGEKYRVILDGHHSHEAAKEAGVEPEYEEYDQSDHDAINWLDKGDVDTFLEIVHMGDDYHDADTGYSIFEEQAEMFDTTPAKGDDQPKLHNEKKLKAADGDGPVSEKQKQEHLFEESAAYSTMTPAQKQIITDKTTLPVGGLKTKLKEWISSIQLGSGLARKQAIFDRYAALHKLDVAATGDRDVVQNSIQQSSWVLARMSNAASSAADAMVSAGRLRLSDDKVFEVVPDSKSLIEVMSQLGDSGEINRFLLWIAGNRSAQLFTEGRENLFTEPEIREMMALSDGKTADGSDRAEVYNRVLPQFNQFRRDVLGIAKKAGILDGDWADTWANDAMYVPFYRVLAEEDAVAGPHLGGDRLSPKDAFKKLKGGTDKLDDLMENTLRNYETILSQSLKNLAVKQAVENAEQLGIAHPDTKGGKEHVAFYEGGKRQYRRIALNPGQSSALDKREVALVLQAINMAMTPPVPPTWMKAPRFAKQLLTDFVTITPQFAIANTFRDLLSVTATSRVKKNFIYNLGQGIKHYGMGLKITKTRAEMMASGGAFAGRYDTVERAHQVRSLNDADSFTRKFIRHTGGRYMAAMQSAENVNRTAAYKQTLDRTGNKLAAAFEARDVVDFSAHGASPFIRMLIQAVPFLNARLQGLEKLYRDGARPAFKTNKSKAEKQQGRRFSLIVGMMSVGTLMLQFMNSDDEEIQGLPEWHKDTYWTVRTGEKSLAHIPKPFEVGALATMVERMAEWKVSDNPKANKLIRDRFFQMFMQTFSFDPTPQLVNPVMEVWGNKDKFRQQPVIRPWEESSTSPYLWGQDNTSQWAQAVSRELHDLGIKGKYLSPPALDHYVNGYLGSVGGIILGGADAASHAMAGIATPAKRLRDYQPLRRFVSNTDDPKATKYVEQFYKALDQMTKDAGDYRKLSQSQNPRDRLRAARLAKEKGPAIAAQKTFTGLSRKIGALNKRIKEVKSHQTMSAEEKRRQIQLLQNQRNKMYEQGAKSHSDMMRN